MRNATLAPLLLFSGVFGCGEHSRSNPDDTVGPPTGESPTSLAPGSSVDPGPTVGATPEPTDGGNNASSDEPSSTDRKPVDGSGNVSGSDVSSGTSANGGATDEVDTSGGKSGVSNSDADGGGSTNGESPGSGESSQNPADGGTSEQDSTASGDSTADASNPATPPGTFRNPLNASHGSDPWTTYYDGHYYLAATTWGDTLTMKRGRTLQELKQASPTVIWRDATASRCCNMWAPEFYLIDGPNGPRWYHYYTAGDGNDLGTQRSHVLESEGLDPMGPYHYRGRLLDYWAIDGSMLETNSGRYFTFSSWVRLRTST